MTLAAFVAAFALLQTPAQTFRAVDDHFELDGKPFVVRSGEMHYPRVPRAYWRDRFAKAKAMGLNTICTYVFWNLHEPEPGKFNFSGNLDLAEYLRLAKAEGLYVILRPGPYICTELDFGGLPSWLQKDRSMQVRSRDPKFLTATRKYFQKVGQVVRPYLLENGGNVILTQVENEYGSYGDDHEYMSAVRDALVAAGFNGQLLTSDGPGKDMLEGGTLPGIPAAVNFGGGGPGAIAELEKFRPGSPKIVGEYWCGWFDHWGERHHTTNIDSHVKDIEWFLKNGVSFNLYMFHGGTSAGFLAGANGDRNTYQLDTTSYDYDSPLDESGRITPKYLAFRDAIERGTGQKLPAIPATPSPIKLAPIRLTPIGLLTDLPAKPVQTAEAPSFEDLGQSYGFVRYSAKSPVAGSVRLTFERVNDYALVYVGDRFAGSLDRRLGQRSIQLQIPKVGTVIRILTEQHARINFGHALADQREGIDGKVTLGSKPLKGWTTEGYPLETPPKPARSTSTAEVAARIYRGTFNLSRTGDTFLDMGSWTKGYVWVNGHNLGRYWKVGPQQTLFLPGPWLRVGGNEIVVLDEDRDHRHPTLAGLDHPVLNAPPSGGLKPLRKPGEMLRLPTSAIATGYFTAAPEWQVAEANGIGRFVALEVKSSQNDQPYASAAEVSILGADGRAIPHVKVTYADSEELDDENGSALHVLDGQPDTIWHTAYSDRAAPMPHVLVFDLGSRQRITGIRYLPRLDGPNGRIKEYAIFLSSTPFVTK